MSEWNDLITRATSSLAELAQALDKQEQLQAADILDNLVGSATIAEWIGMGVNNVHEYASRHPDFPEPIKHIGRTKIWWGPSVRRWAQSRGLLKDAA